MPLSIMDIAIAKGMKPDDRGGYNMGQFDDMGLPFFSGCQSCEASLGPDGAYPSKTGYIQCKDCIGDRGFETVEEFDAFEAKTEEESDA